MLNWYGNRVVGFTLSTCPSALPHVISQIGTIDNEEIGVSTRLCSKALPLFFKCHFAIKFSGLKIAFYADLKLEV
jgi:hypothetical protein